MEASMANSSSHTDREHLGVTGTGSGWTDNDDDVGRTTGEWTPSSSPDSSFHHSLTTDAFNEATTNDDRHNTYSITLFRIVWFVLAITLVMLIIVAVVAVIVRCRRVLVRRRPKDLETSNNVTFRFTRNSSLLLDKKQNAKPSPTSNRGNNLDVPPSTFSGTTGTSRSAGAEFPASESDLYEKDSDCGSWHLECTTFSAVNDNFDEDKLNRR